ncbi:MAG TPA: hypothetical protein GXZ96_02705 [Firmicutes bacterium]|jgi:hypothetical protein|nr:hypothetical protein [Bacillota bacterium]
MEKEPDHKEVLLELERRIGNLAWQLERLRVAEYVEMLQDRRRLFITYFLTGVARGLGMVIGISIVGALLVYILKRLLVANLPAISDYMAHLIRLIEFNLGHG